MSVGPKTPPDAIVVRTDDVPAADVDGWRRALDALPRTHRAMVSRLARVMLFAAEMQPRPLRSRLRAVDASPTGADDDPDDDLTRAAARKLLARHRRGGDAA